jgi:hypothetical protein
MDWAAVLTITVEPAVSEDVTVTAGVAPRSTRQAPVHFLSGRDVALRLPST